MPIESKDVDGLEGLLSEVLRITNGREANSFLWYRGLSHKRHTLLPGIMRDAKTKEEIFDREKRLLTRFRQRSLPYWPSGYPQDDWEHLFAMQHYGVPTRLLDWTENLFVAAHFAVGKVLEAAADDAPVIWCLDPVQWNRATPVLSEYGKSIQVLTTSDDDIEPYRPETTKRRNKSPVAIFGTHNSTRIVAQRGTFMIWGEEPRSLEEFANEMPDALVWQLVVRGSREKLARDLSALGFGETMVFPELGALASELSRAEGWRPVR
jgi:hypothetical protein